MLGLPLLLYATSAPRRIPEVPKWVLGYSSSSRLPLLVFPLPDHGGTNSPVATGTGCSGSHQSVREPMYSHYRQGSFGMISGLPEAILQARKERSGKQRTINVFITPPIRAAPWKTTGEVKTWHLRWHHLIAEHDNKWLNRSLHFKAPFTLILLLIAFPCRIALLDCFSHLY